MDSQHASVIERGLEGESGATTESAQGEARESAEWLVRHRAEWRQVGIVAVYWALLFSMYFVPACRNVVFFGLACYFSFLNSVVIHNHMHQGVFRSKGMNLFFRRVLSFGALYPATVNIPSHNLVHHHFDDDGQPDWADSHNVDFKWNLLNLLHFPNVAGPNTFSGVQRFAQIAGREEFKRQYVYDNVFMFGLTGLLMVFDFWTTLFFIVLPQLYGARSILRINIIQHDGCDITSTWNHSRNFVGKALNWIMCNNGYHTIHHNRAGLHWSVLDKEHEREAKPRIDPSLDEKSMVLYLLRTYVFNLRRPEVRNVALAEAGLESSLASREDRLQEAARAAGVS
ncbi:MAG: fatty acid desaturase [Polyangiaceae bacterium]